MGMGVNLRLSGKRKLNINMRQTLRKKQSYAKDAVKKIAFAVHRDAILSIQRGRKTGAIYGNHQASAPGEAPASDTGNLVSNITMEIEEQADVLTASILSRAPYSKALEFGTRHMEPRPFLRPAYEKHKKDLVPTVKKEYRRG